MEVNWTIVPWTWFTAKSRLIYWLSTRYLEYAIGGNKGDGNRFEDTRNTIKDFNPIFSYYWTSDLILVVTSSDILETRQRSALGPMDIFENRTSQPWRVQPLHPRRQITGFSHRSAWWLHLWKAGNKTDGEKWRFVWILKGMRGIFANKTTGCRRIHVIQDNYCKQIFLILHPRDFTVGSMSSACKGCQERPVFQGAKYPLSSVAVK